MAHPPFSRALPHLVPCFNKPFQVLSDLRALHIQGHEEIEGGLLVKTVY